MPAAASSTSGTCAPSPPGRRVARSRPRSRSCPRASCSRTSRACPRSSTSPRCATRWPTSAAIRRASTRSCRPTWSSTTPSRSTAIGHADAFAFNVDREYERNGERYQLLRWAQTAFDDLRVVPPGHGHRPPGQPRVPGPRRAGPRRGRRGPVAFPDTLVGTDSHTTMINGLGVLGYGVGGIEAEAVLLGQPLYQPMPHVVGVRLSGELPTRLHRHRPRARHQPDAARATAWSGAFVEFAGDGLASLALADRATISNMSPEYGATTALFPIDDETLAYLRLTGRDDELDRARRGVRQGERPVAVARRRARLRRDPRARPGDRRAERRRSAPAAGPGALADLRDSFREAFPPAAARVPTRSPRPTESARPRPTTMPSTTSSKRPSSRSRPVTRRPSRPPWSRPMLRDPRSRRCRPAPPMPTALPAGRRPAGRPARLHPDRVGRHRRHHQLHQHLQPDGHGRRRPAGPQRGGARPARRPDRQDQPRPRVARGHRLPRGRRAAGPARGARLRRRRLRLHDVHRQQRSARRAGRQGRRGQRPGRRRGPVGQPQLRGPHPPAGTGELPGLAAARGRLRARRPRRHRPDDRAARHRRRRTRRSISPTSGQLPTRSARTIGASVSPDLFRDAYASVFDGDERWRALPIPSGDRYAWDPGIDLHRARHRSSTASTPEPAPMQDITGARALAVLGDSVTTDHISPAGSIPAWSPAGKWLQEHGVTPVEFNSYGARRGHHEVMMRGTFGNIRLRNALAEQGGSVHDAPAVGRRDVHLRRGDALSAEGVPLIILAGHEYGSGSSRDWAAKGPALLGVRAVLAESTSASTAPTWWAWASCRSSSCPARTPRRSASPAARSSTSSVWPTASARGAQVASPSATAGRERSHRRHRPARRSDRGRLLPAGRHPAGGAAAAGLTAA